MGQAPGVQIRVQSGSSWPSGPDIDLIILVSSFLGHIQSTMIDEKYQLFIINCVVIDFT